VTRLVDSLRELITPTSGLSLVAWERVTRQARNLLMTLRITPTG
jgi:hypothetical protein